MHYMPWFSLERQNSHWTMQLFEQDNFYLYDRYLQRGKVAAHYTPLIGPYSSTDTDTIRLHLQLMKLSGISGVIVNWYGVNSGALLEASNLVIQEASRTGMMWSICYEDWTIPENAPDPVQKQLLLEDFRYLRDQYFNLPGLLRESEGTTGRPVLFVFGPKRFYNREVWIKMLETVFPGFTDLPLLQGVDRLNPTAILDGNFAWPGWDLFTNPNDPPTVANSKRFTEGFYSSAKRNSWKPVVGVVYPRFRDFYFEGSIPDTAPSWGGLHLPSFNEETLWSTIIAANKSDPHFVQAATWNDFQEGSVFEPTAEDGFLFLSVIQQALLGIEDEDSLRDAVLEYNRLKRQSWQQCDNVPYELRNDCGDLSTTKTSCEDAGCCWRPTTQSGRPWCFHRQSAQVCTCASHLRDCDTHPEDRLCCCKHDVRSPPDWTAQQNCTPPYFMCGVPDHRGPTCCTHGHACRLKNESWAQCVPA